MDRSMNAPSRYAWLPEPAIPRRGARVPRVHSRRQTCRGDDVFSLAHARGTPTRATQELIRLSSPSRRHGDDAPKPTEGGARGQSYLFTSHGGGKEGVMLNFGCTIHAAEGRS